MDSIAPNETRSEANMVQVQQVTKRSSDELLRKFAEMGAAEDEEEKKVMRRRKRSAGRRSTTRRDSGESGYGSGLAVERRSLLPGVAKKSALLVKFGRSHLRRARDMRNKSFLAGIGKTWRMTMEGASRVLLEKHYNQHKRLINDVV